MNYKFYTFFITLIIFTSGHASAQCAVSSLSVYDIVGDSATISWANVTGPVGFEYAVSPATAGTPTTGTPVTGGATIRVGGLSTGAAYKAWLRSNCGSGVYTPWVPLSFSTPCGLPATVGATYVWGDSAIVSWSAVSPTANYEYVIDTLSAMPSGPGTAISTNTVTKKGLLAARTYYVYVRTACASVFSPWSSPATFFSAFPTAIKHYDLPPAIYPNPVTDKLHINGLSGNTKVTVYNTIGTILMNRETNVSEIVLDMAPLPAGIYILRCTNGGDVITKKIEKR